jgi:hypothetical protein
MFSCKYPSSLAMFGLLVLLPDVPPLRLIPSCLSSFLSDSFFPSFVSHSFLCASFLPSFLCTSFIHTFGGSVLPLHLLRLSFQFSLFLRGGAALTVAEHPNPLHWLPNTSWLNLVALSKHPAFTALLTVVKGFQDQWRDWYNSEAPETTPLPKGMWSNITQVGLANGLAILFGEPVYELFCG